MTPRTARTPGWTTTATASEIPTASEVTATSEVTTTSEVTATSEVPTASKVPTASEVYTPASTTPTTRYLYTQPHTSVHGTVHFLIRDLKHLSYLFRRFLI